VTGRKTRDTAGVVRKQRCSVIAITIAIEISLRMDITITT